MVEARQPGEMATKQQTIVRQLFLTQWSLFQNLNCEAKLQSKSPLLNFGIMHTGGLEERTTFVLAMGRWFLVQFL